MLHPSKWTRPDKGGLAILPAGFSIDPASKCKTAVITHGHADHAIRGHETVVATAETHAIMRARYGRNYCQHAQVLNIGEALTQNGVVMTFYPAGHILGSVQVQLIYQGFRLAVSGDYKCGGGDPGCADFEPVPCDVFLTEATFGLPVFDFPNPELEVGKLINSVEGVALPHLVWVYSLGKAQRLQLSLRDLGYHDRIWVHPAIDEMNQVYRSFGFNFGEVMPCHSDSEIPRNQGCIVMAPRGSHLSLADRPRKDFISSAASGWYNIRNHAKRDQLDLPLVISDHCDWKGLQGSIMETGAREIWITHGRSDALEHWAGPVGLKASALEKVGGEGDD
jgi:putative mRNA 3-end processing factor